MSFFQVNFNQSVKNYILKRLKINNKVVDQIKLGNKFRLQIGSFLSCMQKYDEILSAKAWIIMNFNTGSYMRGSNVNKQRQIASLTKMYTLYGCLQINKNLNINPDKTYVKIHQIITTGTSAGLLKNRYISLRDLYFGMMLPSGNDAAALLAFYYGHWLQRENIFPNLIFTKQRKIDLKDKLKYCNLLSKKFMHFLNQNVIKTQLNHVKTKLQNPHGLCNKFQVSTAWQIAEATIYFMKNSREFRDIVNTKKHQGFYYNQENSQQIQSFCWQNTNILLKQPGFEGVKTGHTLSAGSCLCSYKKIKVRRKYEYELIITVLGCSDQQKRFSQTRIICDDLKKYLEELSY